MEPVAAPLQAGPFVEGTHFRVVESGCWLWIRSLKNGYGQFRCGRYAHREVFVASGRTLPPGGLVTHTCDTRSCVNPAHLVAGTKQTNMLDIKHREPEKWARIQAAHHSRRAVSA